MKLNLQSPISNYQLLITLFAFLLRVIGLNSRPLWYDEAFAVLFAEKGFSAMLYGTLTQVQGAAADVHPIAYYSGLNLWMQLVGQSPFAVRMLSAFVGTITVAMVYAIAKELFSKHAALVAMLFTALSPFHVYYSQEARMYAPLALGCVGVVLFFVRAEKRIAYFVFRNNADTHHATGDTQYAIRNTPHASLATPLGHASPLRVTHHAIRNTLYALRYWILLSISSAFALYMQNLAAFFLLAFGLSTLPRPKTFFKVAIAGAGAFVLWLPWFVNITSQFAKLQQAYWVTRPNFATLLQTLLIYHAGEEFVATAKVGVALPLFVGIVVLAMLVFRLARAQHLTGLAEFNAAQSVNRPVRCGRNCAAWLTSLAFGTPLLLFLASLYQPVYIQRALLPASLMYVLAISWLLAESQMPNLIRFALGGIVGVTFVAGLWAHYTFESFPRPSFQSAVSYLKQNLAQGDVIVHSNKLTYFPMYYYDRSLPQKFLADPIGSGSDTLALPTQEVLGLYAISDVQIATRGAKRVWFIIFDRAVEEYKPNPHPHLGWMRTNYVLGQVKKIDDMTIYEFTNFKPQTSNLKLPASASNLGFWDLKFGVWTLEF